MTDELLERMTSRRLVVLVAAMLSLASIAHAQTHPCDAPLPNNPQLTSPVKAGFCHNGKDVNGNSIVVIAFKVLFDGQVVADALLQPIGAPNAAGYSYFETPPVVVSKGNHSSVVIVRSADGESAASSPFAFAVVGALPSPVTASQVKK